MFFFFSFWWHICYIVPVLAGHHKGSRDAAQIKLHLVPQHLALGKSLSMVYPIDVSDSFDLKGLYLSLDSNYLQSKAQIRATKINPEKILKKMAECKSEIIGLGQVTWPIHPLGTASQWTAGWSWPNGELHLWDNTQGFPLSSIVQHFVRMQFEWEWPQESHWCWLDVRTPIEVSNGLSHQRLAQVVSQAVEKCVLRNEREAGWNSRQSPILLWHMPLSTNLR